uniref:Fc epsilon receptor Ia n=2 Tax=Canis lupus familiaris TaxID=9615 RepID=A0A8P0SGG2_CANLF
MIQKTFPSPFWLQVSFKAVGLSSPVVRGGHEEMPASMGGPALLWLALLLSSPGVMSSDTLKPTVSMNPPWNTILKDDSVTLTCTGNNSLEVDSAVWLHNNTTLQETTSRLDINKAQIQDSGEYRCRENRSILSDPVYLTVFTEWLILQASANVVMEGESFLIRCHSWKNLRLTKVTYYKDGIPIRYWYENFNISISNVTTKNSGNYSCSGQIQQKGYTSKVLNIIVKKEPTKQNKYSGLQFLIPLVVVILFAVDTGLFISTKQQLTVLLQIKRTRKNKKPEPGKN